MENVNVSAKIEQLTEKSASIQEKKNKKSKENDQPTHTPPLLIFSTSLSLSLINLETKWFTCSLDHTNSSYRYCLCELVTVVTRIDLS